jgi:transmembrane sensor
VRSQLHIAPDFGVDTRDVRVHGEAFFRVTSDPGRPFVVHTTESMTFVVGTGFAVRSRGDGTEIVVREGTVRIAPLAQNAIPSELSGGTLGRVSPQGRAVEVARVDLYEHLAWMEGMLVFRNVRFRDVLDRLELWYDVEFRVEGKDLPERRLSAFLEHPPLSDLLAAIALAADASYRLDGGIVTFAPGP